jgi:hypothetical protein
VLATGVVVGAFLALLPVIRTTSWVSGVLLVCGALGSLGAGLGSAELQGRLPADMRGRVLSLYGLVILVVPAAGAALAGRASVAVGSAAAMQVAGAIVTTAAVLAALALRTLRATVEIAGQRSQQPLVVEEARAGQ